MLGHRTGRPCVPSWLQAPPRHRWLGREASGLRRVCGRVGRVGRECALLLLLLELALELVRVRVRVRARVRVRVSP